VCGMLTLLGYRFAPRPQNLKGHQLYAFGG
jgi:TnpA family transposase